ncbi:MAG: hypothetical protein IJR92_01150, partial [Alphaproteobacteria bacterium]|nr:hypothetical protein [Alphaproteobacteria bacterium]
QNLPDGKPALFRLFATVRTGCFAGSNPDTTHCEFKKHPVWDVFQIHGADDRIVYSHFTLFVGPFPNRNGSNFILFVLACYFVEPPVQIRIRPDKNKPRQRRV